MKNIFLKIKLHQHLQYHTCNNEKVLELIDEEGLENRWKRHIEMSKYARDWVNSHNQNLFTKNDAISCTLTCVRNVQEWDIEKISQRLLDNGLEWIEAMENLDIKHLEYRIWEIYI